MTGLAHLLVGGVVAAKLSPSGLERGWWWALVGAFFSHFVLDFIPHNDYIYFYLDSWRIVYTSLLNILLLVFGAVLVVLVGWKKKAWAAIFLGAVFGALPDAISGTTELLGVSKTFFDRFHQFFHSRFDLGEFLYIRFSGGSLAEGPGYWAWSENWRRLRASVFGNFGWGVEILVEVLVVAWAIRCLWDLPRRATGLSPSGLISGKRSAVRVPAEEKGPASSWCEQPN